MIEIQQTATTETGFEATVLIAGSKYPITVRAPFAQDDEKRLEWYFEQWIKCPFTDETIAKRAGESVRAYGENLFDQVFAGRAYGAYQKVNERKSDLEIVISGDAEFQGLHWEAMWDRDFARPLAVDCVMVRQRQIRGMVNAGRVQESPVLNLLIVTARPNEEKDVGYRTISRPMVEAIRDAQLRVNVEIVRPGTYEAFVRHLESKLEGFYHVVHFDLHGGLMSYEQFQAYVNHGDRTAGNYTFQRAYGLPELPKYAGVKAFLFFEGDEAGQAVPVTADEIAARLQGRGIPVCILNACQSGKQVQASEDAGLDERETSLGARLMDAGMQMVVAMGYSVTADAAKVLMQRVYGELFAGKALPEALRLGRRELFDRKTRRVYFNQQVDLEDWLLPVVYSNQSVDFRLREMTFAEMEEYFSQQATEYRFAGATYGFVGRDLDILKLEKALLRHGVVLVQGMGGTGKTTLLRYLQEWWVQTNFVEQVFYFGYDTKAWTLEEIMFEIAQGVFTQEQRRQFQVMSIAARMGMLMQTLRSQRFGLMLDNLESVTGQALAIQNTLPVEEQGRIREFLERIAGGKTIILLGSRGQEDWLRSVYRENYYELRGLDQQARTELAQKVLQRHVSDSAKRKAILADKEFERLMRLLAGYPLVIEVVLANLGRLTVAQVLVGLDAADVGLDRAGGKTESILKCVEYSHSNLSPEAQKLLLCLAPFSGFVNRLDLKTYARQLQELEPFQDYLFEQFDAAVQEAINWGLLAPIFEEMPQLLSIQPVFPYFLKTKLNQLDAVTREALEEGFKNHYCQVARDMAELLQGRSSDEQQVGVFICRLEYENLYNSLLIAIRKKALISIPRYALSQCLTLYFNLTGQHEERLKLHQMLADSIEEISLLNNVQDHPVAIHMVLMHLGEIGNSYFRLNQFKQAKHFYQMVLEKLQKLSEYGEERSNDHLYTYYASAYYGLGEVAREEGEFEEANRNYRISLDLAIEFGNLKDQANSYNVLGLSYYKLKQFDTAKKYYEEALRLCSELKDSQLEAGLWANYAHLIFEMSEVEEAYNKLQDSLSIFEIFGDKRGQAIMFNNLGTLARKQDRFEEAGWFYRQCLKLCIELKENALRAIVLRNLGDLSFSVNEVVEAQNCYQQSLDLFSEDNESAEKGWTHMKFGLVLYWEYQFEQAQFHCNQALQLFIKSSDFVSQAQTYNLLGGIEFDQQKYESTLFYWQRALDIYVFLKNEAEIVHMQAKLNRALECQREQAIQNSPDQLSE